MLVKPLTLLFLLGLLLFGLATKANSQVVAIVLTDDLVPFDLADRAESTRNLLLSGVTVSWGAAVTDRETVIVLGASNTPGLSMVTVAV